MSGLISELKKALEEGFAVVVLKRGAREEMHGKPINFRKEPKTVNCHCIGAFNSFGRIGYKVIVIRKEYGVVSTEEFKGKKLFPEFNYQSRIAL